MDITEEYHDPDYPGTSAEAQAEPQGGLEEEKLEKIRNIVHREFSNELEVRENEVMVIDQRLSTSRRMLNRLRYTLVSQYYDDQSLHLTTSQIQDEVAAQSEPRARSQVASLLGQGQRRLHPSVRKLLGQEANLDEILFRSREPRIKARRDYSAMLQTRNYTIAADTTKSLRPDFTVITDAPSSSKPKKVPRHLQPKIVSVMTLDEATRNQMKHRYRIIIGNTSKYAPAASRADRSTHKWLLYVRGPAARPDASRVLAAVTVRLHHSYAPHHTVHLDKPPFHISRRGWGEFPAKVELHFKLPERNRPATVEHTIKLDRNYTGLQTLGAETIVDVWLYSTQEMLQYEYQEVEKDDTETSTKTDLSNHELVQPKEEPIEETEQTNEVADEENDSWLNFFAKDSTELDVDEMIIKPAKKIDERNDLETLIEPSVIPRNSEENHLVNDNDNDNKTNDSDESNCIQNYKSLEMHEDLPNELLTQPTSPKKRIMKYMDPTTGKIYYLEMDRNLDLSKVQEIVINSKGNVKTAKISPIKPNGLKNVRKNTKKGVSLLKPEVKSQLKKEDSKEKPLKNFSHIENDHCYLGSNWYANLSNNSKEKSVNDIVKKEKSLFESLCVVVSRFMCVRSAVNYLLKKIPLISDNARDPDFVKWFPFVVENEEKFWKLDFAKRRNIEWSRAKLINKLLTEHLTQTEQIWKTKQILIYSRLHGYHPVRTETLTQPTDSTDWTSWTELEKGANIKEYYPNASDITTLTKFNIDDYNNSLSESLDLVDSDDEIDILEDREVKVKKEVDNTANLTVLPVNEEDRLRFLFIEKKCADIGVELRNEDVGSGYSYSAVHAVLLSAMKSFAEELVRSSLAVKLMEDRQLDPLPPVWTGGRSCVPVSVGHVHRAVGHSTRLHALSARALAALPRSPDPL